ncbi:SHOCT domain-containing protein [Terrimonas alba]|uniref:SHOCT domain-containing protein n=1 Tax=Terrimonas alba TaxID=3349636 RepID=UPI0035F40591
MVASKSNSQRKKEAELEVLKSMPSYLSQTEQKIEAQTVKNFGPSVNDMYAQLEKLGKLKEQGILNEEEFQQQKKKILG